MTAVLSITGLTCASLIGVVLVRPSVTVHGRTVPVYWAVPLLGACLLLFCSLIPGREVLSALTANTAVNPVKILVLFLSMAFLSIFLDETGFFRYLASVTLRAAHTRQSTLFFSLYLLVSVLTVFTSNDIIILTFTPFICYFAKNAKIDPLPYLVAEFAAANTWSMALVIGNPTNIYLSAASGVGFLQYLSYMILPTVCAGGTSLLILWLLFRRRLRRPLSAAPTEPAPIADRPALLVGLFHLGGCTVLLAVSSYIGIPMWLVSAGAACGLLLCASLLNLRRGRAHLRLLHCIARIPWELVPFVLSMFVLVLAMNHAGVTAACAARLGSSFPILKYGISSFLCANLVNNIPMSVFFSEILAQMPAAAPAVAASGAPFLRAVFATVIGSNLCAVFTPIGALAGIMWSGILKTQRVRVSFFDFLRFGAAIAIPSLAAALGMLSLCL